MMRLLINIDVPDLNRGTEFYTTAFDFYVKRRFANFVELSGAPVPIFLIQQNDETVGAGQQRRTYGRHWCPIHLDILVGDLASACDQAVKAGAVLDGPIRREAWGDLVTLADPFGHGVCLIRFTTNGYDALQEE